MNGIAFDHLPVGDQTKAQMAIGDGGLVAVGGTIAGLSIVDGPYLIGRNVLRLSNVEGTFDIAADDPALVLFGMRHAQSAIEFAGRSWISLRNAAGAVRVEIKTTAGVAMEVFADGVSQGTFNLPLAAWPFVEVAAKISASADGWVVVRLEGDATPVFSATGIVTGDAADIDVIRVSGHSNYGYYTDIYSTTALDSSSAPGWLNPVRLLRRLLTGDVLKGFTPSTGTDNYAMVDEATTDEDSSYLTSDEVDLEDQYTVAANDAGLALTPVIGRIVGMISKAPAGGAPTLSPTLEQGAVKGTGTARNAAYADYRTQQHVFTAAPGGGGMVGGDVIKVGMISGE